MNLILHLAPETEAKLREQASREGKDPETIALEALEEKLSLEQTDIAPLPKEARVASFRALMASMPDGNPNADVSRESIYE